MGESPILFHGDGNSKRGLGHLVRSVGTALEIPTQGKVFFATSNLKIAQHVALQLTDALNSLNQRPNSLEFIEWAKDQNKKWADEALSSAKALVEIARKLKASWIVSDGKYPWPEKCFEEFEDQLILIDNPDAAASSERHFIFPTDHYVHIPQLAGANVQFGMPWIWVHPKVRLLRKKSSVDKKYDVSISMGGADPDRRTLEVLARLEALKFRGTGCVLIGSAFQHRPEIESILKNKKGWVTLDAAEHLHETILRSRTLLTAFGITMYEAYALGVPVAVVRHSAQDPKEIVAFFERHPTAGKFIDSTKFGIEDIRLAPSVRPDMETSLPESLGRMLRPV